MSLDNVKVWTDADGDADADDPSSFETLDRFEDFAVASPGSGDEGMSVADELAHDAAGNLTYDGSLAYAYDAWNRMVQVKRAFRSPSGGGTLQYGSVVSTSAYDGLGRRITKVVSNSGDLDMTYHFYYEGQSIIEIRNGSDLVLKQHVWANFAGGYVDELIENDVNADPADGSEQDCEIRGWACQDANYNVIGFVDDDLAVRERYEYTPYGQRVVFYSAGSNDPLAHTPTLIPRRVELSGTSGGYGAYAIGHQGLYHDEETGETLVYNRARMLHTRLGRWVQREPLRYVDGMNLYQYVYSQPIHYVDPTGLWAWDGGWIEYGVGGLLGFQGEEIKDASRDAFSREAWDRTNGTLDALTFGNADLGTLTGTDHTFDPTSREAGRCLAACLADAGVNAINPTGVPVNVFDDLNKPIVDPSLNPLDWAPGVSGTSGNLLGHYADAHFGHGHQWTQWPGRIPAGPAD